jgi:hypothetical protein
MNKLISILLVVFILLSGVHLSVATHFCCGELTDFKVSFTGQNARCGCDVAVKDQNSSRDYSFKSNCCADKLKILSVDQNYAPSVSIINIISQKIIQVFTVPVLSAFGDFLNTHSLQTLFLYPQNVFRTNTVSLAFICVFRK